MSQEERSGWRDPGISNRHRTWGWDVPVVDIDWLEYDRGEPVALVEYKHESAGPQTSKHPSHRALISLGTRAKVPVFACRYNTDFTKNVVTPLNSFAKPYLPVQTVMNEREYVAFLYQIRGRQMPLGIFDADGNIIIDKKNKS